ncbi:MAG: ATP-binding cassette domain-containing protein, partial [Proteobacteria bacterium]|nr:ATP-binding cassette domain-containing protein [Pseudomonadota bacterium]
VPGGGGSLMVRGRQRHVVAYLRDFLFDEGQARQPVKSLSGGERNRLLLACLFARPSDLLVLDEPTNDLDLETLDLLVETLDDYPGTLILVSHDRDVLDRLATGIIAIEAGGRAIEYAGGYSDALIQQRGRAETGPRDAAAQATRKARAARAKGAARKLGYKEQRELARLPGEIARLEIDLAALEDKLADPELYERDPEAFEETAARLEATRARLSAAETRWLELETRREQLAAAPEGGA